MGKAPTNRRVRLATAVIAVAVLGVVASATAADPWSDVRVRPEEMVGTPSCSAVSCHGGGGPRYWSRAAAGAENVHWMGHAGTYSEGRRHYDPRARLEISDGDPHALAGQRITSSRFQDVLSRASQRADGSVDAAMYQRCAKCHDPAMGRQPEDISPPTEPADRGLVARSVTAASRGIECETCHGGAKQWYAVHYEQGISRERLLELGMVDTKNLLVRARLCASCHVGSAENDMNHDMIAAGHPPLRFELSAYEALIGTKHWDDRPRRAAERNYEVQLWAAGRVAAAEAALALLEGRAQRATRNATEGVPYGASWPEFAEGNCFACHQPMRSMANGPTASRSSGKIAWQSWNFALLNSVVSGVAAKEGELPPAAFGPSLQRLRAAMEASFEPPPAEIANLAAAARVSLRSMAKIDSSGRVLDREGHPLGTRAALGWHDGAATRSWDELCHKVAALAAARRAIEDATNRQQIDAERRLMSVARLLRFTSADREWPAIMSSTTPLTSLDQELDAIRRELSRQVSDRIGGQP